jgi:hypothetical protein
MAAKDLLQRQRNLADRRLGAQSRLSCWWCSYFCAAPPAIVMIENVFRKDRL